MSSLRQSLFQESKVTKIHESDFTLLNFHIILYCIKTIYFSLTVNIEEKKY